jgi:hypothetical protein
MFAANTMIALTALSVALSGCATGSSPAEPHQHMRDAKQGSTLPTAAASTPAPTLLHDHREMK